MVAFAAALRVGQQAQHAGSVFTVRPRWPLESLG
jgi:hypothetical protein